MTQIIIFTTFLASTFSFIIHLYFYYVFNFFVLMLEQKYDELY